MSSSVVSLTQEFQSTLPVWGATIAAAVLGLLLAQFQSTLPVWGATGLPAQPPAHLRGISIHAPRVGSDLICNAGFFERIDFNPRSPCGERLSRHHLHRVQSGFQSTLPVWGATRRAPHTPAPSVGFQSTLPVWGATWPAPAA